MFNKRFQNRFWNKVSKSSALDCWIWTGAKNKVGQGFFRVHYGRKMDMAYRVSWMIANKIVIPLGKEVMHSCDNPSCVNPKHLSIGTHAENIKDMMLKGRHRTSPTRGKNHYHAKLSETDIREIRASKSTQNELAIRFGVSQAHISRIILKLSWTHIL